MIKWIINIPWITVTTTGNKNGCHSRAESINRPEENSGIIVRIVFPWQCSHLQSTSTSDQHKRWTTTRLWFKFKWQRCVQPLNRSEQSTTWIQYEKRQQRSQPVNYQSITNQLTNALVLVNNETAKRRWMWPMSRCYWWLPSGAEPMGAPLVTWPWPPVTWPWIIHIK